MGDIIHSRAELKRTHRKPKQLPSESSSPCSPTTRTLQANFKPWLPLQVQKSPGTTGLWKWTPSAQWSLANSNNQRQQWRKMWINFLTTSSFRNTNNFKSEHQWRTNGRETIQGQHKCQKM